MKLFSFEEIKGAGDCLRYMREVLGAVEVEPGRFHCPWRAGSDSGAFSVTEGGWFDHVTKEKGSVIDLCARARHNGNMMAAQEELGAWLGLSASVGVKDSHKVVAVYDYRSVGGELVHQTVRFEPKAFSQRRPDPARPGEWVWSLEGIETVLYRLPDWHGKSWVCVCEGEKDADALAALGVPATTVPMGAEKWEGHYGEWLRGKDVVLVPDCDAPGRAHARKVCGALEGVAKSVRVVVLPLAAGEGKDVSDWLGLGNGREAFLGLVKKTPRGGVPAAWVDVDEELAEELTAAKRANQVALANYVTVEVEAKGRTKLERRPRQIRELVADVHKRFLGFPRQVGGGALFDFDRDHGKVRWIDGQSSLFAWMGEKSRQPVQWARLEGGVGQAELYEALRANARYYEGISGVPHWPARDEVFYTHGKLPAADPRAEAFEEFCAFFSPATREDAWLIRALVASVMYYRHGVPRPMWVIDSSTGQESGKSTLVYMIAKLYGGELESQTPIDVPYKQLQNDTQQERVFKRVLSQSGRQKRLFLLDNVDRHLVCPELAAMLTQPAISGLAPYGRGEEIRPNDLTYVVTGNSVTLDTDLAGRSWFIHLARSDHRDAEWAERLREFIETNRMQILADIVGLLDRGGAGCQFEPQTRCPEWEREVLMPVVGDAFADVWKVNHGRQTASDSEKEEAETVRERLQTAMRDLGMDPEADSVWIQSEAAVVIAGEVIAGGQRVVMRTLKTWAKNRAIPELSVRWDTYPHRGNQRRRGIGWRVDGIGQESAVMVVGTTSDRPPRLRKVVPV